jgi:hypothetical protein
MAYTGKTDFPLGGSNDRSTLNKFYTFPNTVGNVIFVSSTLGTSSGPGFTPHSAYATIDQAIGACTADNNDLILVAPGHTETVVAASGIDLDVAGITIQGLGQGSNRPTVTMGTATTASVDFSAANCTLRNIRFVSNIDNLVNFIEGGAANATIEDCEFSGASTKEVLSCIWIPTTHDNWTIRGCKFIQATDPAGSNAGAGTGAIYLVDSENVLIENCEFRGGFETGFVHNKTTAAANLWIKNCYGILSTVVADAVPLLLVSTATGGLVTSYFTNANETQVTEATLSGTFGAGFFNFGSLYGNDGGGGQLAVAGQAAAT